MGHCCQSSGTQRDQQDPDMEMEDYDAAQGTTQGEETIGETPGGDEQGDDDADAKGEEEKNKEGGSKNRAEKLTIIDKFLRNRYPLDHGYEKQPSLKELIREIVDKLKDYFVKELLGEENAEEQKESASWSDKQFLWYLQESANEAEKTVYADRGYVYLDKLAPLASAIDESPDKLNDSQKEITQRILCNGVLSRALPHTTVINDKRKDKFFLNVATEIMKRLKRHAAEYAPEPAKEGEEAKTAEKEEEWRVEKRAELVKESQKKALRRIALKEYKVSHLVRHFNLIVAEKRHLLPSTADKDAAKKEDEKDDHAGDAGAVIDNLSQPKQNDGKAGAVDQKAEHQDDKHLQPHEGLKREDRKDKAVLSQLLSLAFGILDIYRESEDSAEFDSDCLKEVITLAGLRHPRVFRRLLEQLISDIDNDNLLAPDKLKGLASVLLMVNGHRDGAATPEERDAYCRGDDLKACLSLLARKFDTLLLSDDNENVHHILDTLNIVLTLMASMQLKGMLKSESEEMNKRLDNFASSQKTKITALLKGISTLDFQSTQTNEEGYFSLRVKTDYAREALKRIGGVASEIAADREVKARLGVMGAVGLLRGFVTLDMEGFGDAIHALGGIYQMTSAEKAYSWFEIIQILQLRANTEFSQFKECLGAEVQNKTDAGAFIDKLMIHYSDVEKERITFFVIDQLDRTARNREGAYDDRIWAVDCLKALHADHAGRAHTQTVKVDRMRRKSTAFGGQDAARKALAKTVPDLAQKEDLRSTSRVSEKTQEDDIEEDDIVIKWPPATLNTSYYVRDVLARLSNLPIENFSRAEISERAKQRMMELTEHADKALQNLIKKAQELHHNKKYSYSDYDDDETNKMVVRTLSDKMVVQDFLSSIRMKGMMEYRRDVTDICMIDIQGDQYINGLPQTEVEQKEKKELVAFNEKTKKSDLFKYFQVKRKVADSRDLEEEEQDIQEQDKEDEAEGKEEEQPEDKAKKDGEDADDNTKNKFKMADYSLAGRGAAAMQQLGKDKKKQNVDKVVGAVNDVLLYEGIPKFLNSPSRVLLVQGDAGTGKSIFLKVVEHQLWKAYERGHTEFVPIFIRLAEVVNPSNCVEELIRSQGSGRTTYSQLKNSENTKFLIMLDGYDELKAPKNMYITNRLAEWKGTVKVLITSRQEYLAAYGNYQQYFKPGKAAGKRRAQDLFEYRISEVSQAQREVYIKKRVNKGQNRILTLDSVADCDEIATLEKWGSLKKYEEEIERTSGLKDLIKTPYMLTIIINIMPELEKQKTSGEEGITKSAIYKTFTKQHFIAQACRMMDNESDRIPKGFDLETSFYNYSLDIAIEMFIQDAVSVKAVEYNYPYPTRKNIENKFEKFFTDDPKVSLAQRGAQLIIMDGRARFTHKSIMEYFAARVIYEAVKLYEKPPEGGSIDQGTNYDRHFINEKLVKGSGETDSESDVLNFVLDMIRFNDIKQREMKAAAVEEQQQQTVHAYDKLNTILEMIKSQIWKEKKYVDKWGNERSFGKSNTKSNVKVKPKFYADISPLQHKWQYNMLILAAFFDDMLRDIDPAVINALFMSSLPQSLREIIIFQQIRLCVKEDREWQIASLCRLFVAKRLDGTNYEGLYDIYYDQSFIEAKGTGTVFFADQSWIKGEFVDGKLVETGKIQLQTKNGDVYSGRWEERKRCGKGKMVYKDGSEYDGEWKDDKRHGAGIMTYRDGRIYDGPFEEDKEKGKGVIRNPEGNPRTLFNSGNLPKWLLDIQRAEGKVAVLKASKYNNFESSIKFGGGWDNQKGYMYWDSQDFNYTYNFEKGFPSTNFELSFEFKTSDRECGLCEFYSSQSSGGNRDRRFVLRKGELYCRLFGGDQKEDEIKMPVPPKKKDKKKGAATTSVTFEDGDYLDDDALDDLLAGFGDFGGFGGFGGKGFGGGLGCADGKFHQVKMVVAEDIELWLDDTKIRTILSKDLKKKEFNNKVTRLYFGYSDVVGRKFEGTIKNYCYKEIRPPNFEGKIKLIQFSGEDMDDLYNKNKGKGLEGEMELQIKDNQIAADDEEIEQKETMKFKGTLSFLCFKFENKSAAKFIIEQYKKDPDDKNNLTQSILDYADRRYRGDAALIGAINKYNPVIADFYIKKLWGNKTRKIAKLILQPNEKDPYPGHALVRNEDKNEDYDQFPVSWYELGIADDALMVYIDEQPNGRWIREFFNQDSVFYNYSESLRVDAVVAGHRVPGNSPEYKVWRVNDDGTISPSRSKQLVIGYDKQKFIDGSRCTVLVNREDPRVLVFKDLKSQNRIDQSIIPLVLESHKGKAIVWDEENEFEQEERGYSRFVKIGEESKAIKVFLDKDSHICSAEYPWLCFDASDHTNKKFKFFSKWIERTAQKFIIGNDGSLSWKDYPNKRLGIEQDDPEEVAYIGSETTGIIIIKDFQKFHDTLILEPLRWELKTMVKNLEKEIIEKEFNDKVKKLRTTLDAVLEEIATKEVEVLKQKEVERQIEQCKELLKKYFEEEIENMKITLKNKEEDEAKKAEEEAKAKEKEELEQKEKDEKSKK